jgi:hypothetical protein
VHTCVRPTGLSRTTGGDPPATPPRPLGICLDGADDPTNAKAGRIYAADSKAHTSGPTERLAGLVSSTDSSIALLFIFDVMIPPASSRSRRILPPMFLRIAP